jgi:predicted kinase
VYEELIRRAEVVLRSGRSVILDASFRGRVQRTAARELAERVGCECLFVEASAAPEVCRSRLRERARSPSVSDGRIDIFDAFMKQFEVIDELPAGQHSRIDTGGSQDQTRAQIARLLRG